MNYEEFLTQVIDNGLKSIAEDARMAKYPKRVEGSKEGFEACRGKTPEQLAQLLVEANRKTLNARMDYKGPTIEEYWKQVHYALQIEWVCNSVSALLMNQGLPVIVNPTARGLINASKIVGVSSPN